MFVSKSRVGISGSGFRALRVCRTLSVRCTVWGWFGYFGVQRVLPVFGFGLWDLRFGISVGMRKLRGHLAPHRRWAARKS